MSLRDRILNADDVPSELVDVPEWDTKLLIKGMTGRERNDLYERIKGNDDRNVFMSELILTTACDPNTGDLLFEPADRDMLSTKSASALARVFRVAMRLSGLGADAETDALGKSEGTTGIGGSSN